MRSARSASWRRTARCRRPTTPTSWCVVFDATQGIRRSEQALYREFVALEKPVVVVLNKIDLVRRERDKVVAQAAANLGLAAYQVIPISAKDGTNLERVLVAIAKTEPEIDGGPGPARCPSIAGGWPGRPSPARPPPPPSSRLPRCRSLTSSRCWRCRLRWCWASPASTNTRSRWKRARELIVTFGLGFVGRTVFQELSKLGGPPGWLLSAAIASSTTVVMGYAAAMWFERGERADRRSR